MSRRLFGSPHVQAMRKAVADREGGTFEGPGITAARLFERDYHAATGLLRLRMNDRYPPSFHERLGATANLTYGRSERRVDVVDTVSMAVAMALREGASVEQAAEAGAVSVGI